MTTQKAGDGVEKAAAEKTSGDLASDGIEKTGDGAEKVVTALKKLLLRRLVTTMRRQVIELKRLPLRRLPLRRMSLRKPLQRRRPLRTMANSNSKA